MLLYRSLSLGLLGACLLMLATHPAVVVEQAPRTTLASHTKMPSCMPPGTTIIDVAPGTTAAGIPSLLHLGIDERIAAVDDVPVASTLDAGIALGRAELYRGHFTDIDVRSGTSQRRVLVLMH